MDSAPTASSRSVQLGHTTNLILTGQEDIDERKNLCQRGTPAIFRVVVRIERKGESGLFEPTQEIGKSGVETSLQIKRGEVEVARLREEVEVQLRNAKLGHRSGKRENVTSIAVG